MQKKNNTPQSYHHNIFSSSFILEETLIIQKPIELLEAAVIKHLAYFIPEKNELAINIYFFFTLSHFTVGKFENVALRKLEKNITEISLYETQPFEHIIYGEKHVRNLVKDYLNGHELLNSLRERLERNWIAQGKPYGDFEIWIQNVMKYGGYLDLPVGFRQGDKLYTPNELYTQRKKLYNSASSILLNGLRQDNLLVTKEKKAVGRPGLSGEDLIYRLAKAQEAKDIRQENPEMRWKEIAKGIGWRFGYNKAGVKLLADARQRLVRMEMGEYGEEVKLEVQRRGTGEGKEKK